MQPQENKLSTRFKPEIYTVLEKKGNSVIIQCGVNGNKLCRNVSCVKKFQETYNQDNSDYLCTDSVDSDDDDDTSVLFDNNDHNDHIVDGDNVNDMEEAVADNNPGRPVRQRRRPCYLDDYEL